MQTNNQYTEEDQIDIIEIVFTILSQRILIISSLIVFTLFGIIYNYYHHDIFQTNATILVSEDQSDPSSFINNNEYQFLYNNKLENKDQASIFKSTLILNQIAEKLGFNYRYFKKNTWKANKLLTKESLPFEFIFKETITENTCIISYNKDNVVININDTIFSFSKNESEFENSIFSYKPKFLNYTSSDTFIIHQFDKNQTIDGIKSSYTVQESKNSNTYDISYSGPNKELNSKILKGIVDGIKENNLSEKKNIYKLSINFIDLRISKLKTKIDSLNYVISSFKISNGVYMPESQTNSALSNLNDIEQKIFKNSLQSELSVKLLKEVQKQTSFELLPTDIGIENDNINQMVFQFNKIILEKNNLLVEATEKNPLVIQSQNQLIDLRSNIINSLNIYIN